MTSPDELVCPLLIVREVWPEDPYGDSTYRLERCDGPLYFRSEGYNDIDADSSDEDFTEPAFGRWRVECSNGHVLLTHDTEDRSAPFTSQFVRDAAAAVGGSVEPEDAAGPS